MWGKMSENDQVNLILVNRELEIEDYYQSLQRELVKGFQGCEGGRFEFQRDSWVRDEGGGGTTYILQGGDVFEKVGIGFSHIIGKTLPPSASDRREDIGGQPYCAMGVSLVAHPRSPLVPTSHMNVRYFRTRSNKTGEPVWWFGGGYDLTPYYGYREDCIHWHQVAREVCSKHYDEAFYEKLKQWCDRYFFIKHRNCARGIGGIFFDDLQEPDFDHTFAFMSDVGRSFAEAYFPIVDKRKEEAFSEKQKEFQLYRRGRYVEFNLVYDRGTLFGLQSGGRVESILMSMPPRVRFDYGWKDESGSWEEALEKVYLVAQDWANTLIED